MSNAKKEEISEVEQFIDVLLASGVEVDLSDGTEVIGGIRYRPAEDSELLPIWKRGEK